MTATILSQTSTNELGHQGRKFSAIHPSTSDKTEQSNLIQKQWAEPTKANLESQLFCRTKRVVVNETITPDAVL